MTLGRHRKVEERSNEHDCDFCDESFLTRDLLLDHFAQVHHEENIINTIEMCDKIMEDMGVKKENGEDEEKAQEEQMDIQ